MELATAVEIRAKYIFLILDCNQTGARLICLIGQVHSVA